MIFNKSFFHHLTALKGLNTTRMATGRSPYSTRLLSPERAVYFYPFLLLRPFRAFAFHDAFFSKGCALCYSYLAPSGLVPTVAGAPIYLPLAEPVTIYEY
jgi:hypothetical protein